MSMKKSVGIFGGTFDPVHVGHLEIAQNVIDKGRLDKVIFLPNANPPHKDISQFTDFSHRYNMLKIATEDNPLFEVSDYERDATAIHYTVDTMRYFRSLYGKDNTVLIVGADSLDYIHEWKDGADLIKENKILVINRHFRNGYSLLENINKIKALGGNVEHIEMDFQNISSSDIREAVGKNLFSESMTTKKVWEYILKNNLYCKG